MRKGYRVLLGLLALSMALLSGCGKSGAGQPAQSGAASEAVEETPLASKPPAQSIRFEGKDLEGNPVTSEIFSQSKLTMVNVWATYCNPCLREMPDFGELAAEYDQQEFQIIGIVSDVLEGEDQSLAESLIRRTGADYTHLLLNKSIYNALLTEVSGVPTTFFVDEKGNVLDVVAGAKAKTVWKEKIDGLLEGL